MSRILLDAAVNFQFVSQPVLPRIGSSAAGPITLLKVYHMIQATDSGVSL